MPRTPRCSILTPKRTSSPARSRQRCRSELVWRADAPLFLRWRKNVAHGWTEYWTRRDHASDPSGCHGDFQRPRCNAAWSMRIMWWIWAAHKISLRKRRGAGVSIEELARIGYEAALQESRRRLDLGASFGTH